MSKAILNVLIIGATSAIAQAIAKRYAKQSAALYLIARDASKLNAVAQDLRVRYNTQVHTDTLDVMQSEKYEGCLAKVYQVLPKLDVAIIAHGTLPDQKACEHSLELTTQEFKVNGLSYIQLLTLLANRFEQQGSGSLVAIGSCAGDRGRQSNYVYGTAKAAIATFTQGLRHRLASKDVNVLLVKPGFVDTPMTKAFKKGLLWAKPEQVAHVIVKAIDRKKSVIYVPWFWRIIMCIIKNLPDVLFNKTQL